MPIDWFTVVAQAINFFILVWLMKRFLYKPILNAIDERERRIAVELAHAEATNLDAENNRDLFVRKTEDFDREREAMLKKASDEAQAERQRLLELAREEADGFRAKRADAMRSEQESLHQEISDWTQQEVFAIARKALKDLATTDLEERMCQVFVERLREVSGTAKEQLSAALQSSTNPAMVRSAFELPAEQQSRIQDALRETFASDVRLQFVTGPELVAGIEVSVNGQKLGWNIADYLTTLEDRVSAS